MIDVTDLIGTPFAYGARGPNSFDCWGLVRVCYQRWHGVELPDYPSGASMRSNIKVVADACAQPVWEPLQKLVPGCVLVLREKRFGAHVGFALSPTRMIHALEGVGVVSLRTQTYSNQIIGQYHYVP